MTRKEQRQQVIRNIKEAADWGDDGAIQNVVELIEHEIDSNDIDLQMVRKCLRSIKELCVRNHSQNERNRHAFNMACEYALLIGDQYDPMI